MTIAKRLMILVGVPLLVLIGLGIFTRVQLTRIETRTRFVAETQVGSLAALGNISRTYAEMRVHVRGHLLSDDKAGRDQARAAYLRDKAALTKLLREYGDTLISDDTDRRLWGQFGELTDRWSAGIEKVFSLSQAGHHDEAVAMLLGPTADLGARLSKVSGEWILYNERLGTSAGKDALASIYESEWKTLAAVLVGLALTGILGWLTFRKIVKPIRALHTSVEFIARGEYHRQVPFTKSTDETGILARSIDVLKQGAAAMEEQRWVNANAAELTTKLQGAASLSEFGERVLTGLVPMLGGGVAGFYVFESSLSRIARIAGYGLADNNGSGDTLALGQGLAGQCARERKPVASPISRRTTCVSPRRWAERRPSRRQPGR